jgi:hypothetical protein
MPSLSSVLLSFIHVVLLLKVYFRVCFFPSFALICYPEPVLECASSAMIVGGHNELSSSGMIADDR